MTIKELFTIPSYETLGGFTLIVKTVKKKWEIGNDKIQQVVLTDKTGDILADICLRKTQYGFDILTRCLEIIVIAAEMQETETGERKLYVSQYNIPSRSEPDYGLPTDYPDWDKINRGKVRHGLVCSYIKANKPINKSEIEALVEYIIDGE